MREVMYEGVLYQIEYKPELSNNRYTRKRVYYIKTEEDCYPKAHKSISAIMNDGSWRAGEYEMKNKTNPSLSNHLHPYHEFTYDEEKDVYVYTLIIPYDD